MSTKLTDLAEKLNIDLKELKSKIVELGFDLSPRARVIEDDIAELVFDELSPKDDFDDLNENDDQGEVAEIYDELISKQQEREIIKSQRKKTAGKTESSRQSSKELEVTEKLGVLCKAVEISQGISVKEFSEKSGIPPAKVIGQLMKNGILANINQTIDFDTAQIIADDLGVKVRRKREVAEVEDFLGGDISNLLLEDDTNFLVERPPVVVVMGHVDHGKTKLLDCIRESDVVSGESGGITQHIGAYSVTKKGRSITFLDTPGHEAFTSMRARGAKVTDIAILVVAADEGVKPQTIEAINHARDAKIPIIVAINKIDKPDASPDKVMAELAEHDLQPEQWGGNVVMVPVSALNGQGIDDLLDMVLLTAEIENLRANPNREAVGTVIEANLDKNLGPIATILVNTGTLKIMDNVIVGQTFGRIKIMKDHNGVTVLRAGPSCPVLIAGLHETPKSGDILQVVSSEKTARSRADEIRLLAKQKSDLQNSDLNKLISKVKSDKILKIVLKADAKGSIEAIKQSLAKIEDEDVAVKIIHSGVGTVSETDIMMASASGGLVIAFHTDFFSSDVKKTSEREHVEVRKYSVIYNLIEDVKKILSGLIEPEIVEKVIGKAEVKQIFLTKKKDMIFGCKILSGKAKEGAKVHVYADEELKGSGVINSLRKVDKTVKELGEGNECGIKYSGDQVVSEGDLLEIYEEEEKIRIIE